MSDRIGPALTPEEWASDWTRTASMEGIASCGNGYSLDDDPADLAYIIAIANSRLPDDDPRKITRADVHELAYMADQTDNDALLRIAAKLDALLPPE